MRRSRTSVFAQCADSAFTLTNKTNLHVRFNNFSESSLDILVMFYFDIQDYGVELREREAILLRTMVLMNEIGVKFAFPTRTLKVDAAVPAAKVKNAAISGA